MPPQAFEACVRQGGRVRRVSGPSKEHGLSAGEYVNFCFHKGKSHRGEVKKAKKEGALAQVVRESK